jgi:sugar transferase (PEP-CTERM/EpsH1 system associated)
LKILWLKTELLHPLDKGGRIRSYHMLKELKKDHRITYLTLDDGSSDESAYDNAFEYANEIITIPHCRSPKFSVRFFTELLRNLFSPMPYALQKYVSAEMRRQIADRTREKKYDLLICDFLAPAVNLPSGLGVPTLLFQHNVEAMIWRRHSDVANDPLRKVYFELQWKRMRNLERKLCRRFDRIVAVSNEDAEAIKTDYGVGSVSHVGTGVDTNYFSEDRDLTPDRPEIVFTGSMDWLPNDDAVRWFLRAVLPRIREKLPEASFSIVGRNPSRTLVEYGRSHIDVAVTGRVDDVRPYMRKARVYVVPIRIGGGTRLKIYEAMAMGLPVVSTTIGAEGLPVRDGEGIMVRDRPDEFADAVSQLLCDAERASEIGRIGAGVVRENYSWEKITADFNAACIATVERYRSSTDINN